MRITREIEIVVNQDKTAADGIEYRQDRAWRQI
jgi:hypothetical protein